MGAKINIGFVKSDVSTFNGNYYCLIDFLNNNGMKVKGITFSTNKNGLKWVEISNPHVSETKKLVDELKKAYYCEFKVTDFPYYNNSYVDVVIRIDIYGDDFYSFTLEMEEAFIIQSYEISDLEFVETFIINFMKTFCRKLKMDYAFSCQEAEVVFSPEKFKNLTQPYYSIEARYDDHNNLKISKASWYINGVTNRKIKD
ncbi:Imm64 family immunity protein [Lysinibacillus sp. LZ02]|uniref:Imm64 family immunity protein n=1 Tax=Lysinibacillus sp. LZ02 TaxID=3420668 RepID=UPI003D360DFD